MTGVAEHTRAIKIGGWLIVVVLSIIAIIGVVDRYQRQRLLLLEGQHALLTHRSSWGYSTLVRQLATHKLQQSQLLVNPLPPGCLSDQYILEQQRSTAIRTEDIDYLAQYTLRIPINQLAALPSPQAPRLRLTKGVIQLTSRLLMGYSCIGHYAVIRETQTHVQPLPLPPRTAIGPAFVDSLVVHIAVTHGQASTLYVNANFIGDKADLLPATSADWPRSHRPGKQSEERFVRNIENPQYALRLQFFSEPLAPKFLALFLSWNGLGLLLLAGVLSCLFLINWLMAQLIDAYEVQHRAATHDFLTGLCNRQQAMTLANTELARAKRKSGSLCMLMVDIDHFKKVNDTYGHGGGDQVLKFLAVLLKQAVRQHDVVARIGGEEFLILLPDTELKDAQLMAARILQTLRDSTMDYVGRRIGITCSLGIASWRGADDSVQDMLIRADALLYQAKQQGRDRYMSD